MTHSGTRRTAIRALGLFVLTLTGCSSGSNHAMTESSAVTAAAPSPPAPGLASAVTASSSTSVPAIASPTDAVGTSSAVTTETGAVTITSAVTGISGRPDLGRNHTVSTLLFDNGPLPLSAGLANAPLVRSWGVISQPTDATAPSPLVVVLHGAHAFCTDPKAPRRWPCPTDMEDRNQDGLAYLTDALAANGFVAVALGINEEFASDTSGTATGNGASVGPVLPSAPGTVTAAIIERDVIGPLRRGEPIGSLPARAVDLSSVVLVGHSRGATIAGVLGTPDGARRLSVPVSGAVLLAPATDLVDPAALADVPTAVVIGSCDGDTGVDGGEYLTSPTARLRRTPVALVLVDRATHNGVNDRLGPDPSVDGRPGCDAALDPSSQQRQYASIVPELARSVGGFSSVGVGPLITDPARPSDRMTGLDGVRIVHVDPVASTTPVIDPTVSSPAWSAGQPVTRCPAGGGGRSADTPPACHRIDLPDLVGRPASVHVAWSLRSSTPVLWNATTVPDGAIVVVRVFADPIDNATRRSVRIGVGGLAANSPTTTGSNSGSSPVPPGSFAWEQTFEVPVASIGPPVTGAGVRRGAVLWSEFRFRAAGAASGLAVRIAPDDQTAAGSIDVVGLDLVTDRAGAGT